MAPFHLLRSGLEEVTQRANKFKYTKDINNLLLEVKESETSVLYLQKEASKIEMVVWVTEMPDEETGYHAIYLVGHNRVYPKNNKLRCKVIPTDGLNQYSFERNVYDFLTSDVNFTCNISPTLRPELFYAASKFFSDHEKEV